MHLLVPAALLLSASLLAEVSLHYVKQPPAVSRILGRVPRGQAVYSVLAINQSPAAVTIDHAAILAQATRCTSPSPLPPAPTAQVRASQVARTAVEASAEILPILQYSQVLKGPLWISAGAAGLSLGLRMLIKSADRSAAQDATWLQAGQTLSLPPGRGATLLFVAASRGGSARFSASLDSAPVAVFEHSPVASFKHATNPPCTAVTK